MQQPTRSTLDVIYENWHGYRAKLRACIAPLTSEQLFLQPAAHMVSTNNRWVKSEQVLGAVVAWRPTLRSRST